MAVQVEIIEGGSKDKKLKMTEENKQIGSHRQLKIKIGYWLKKKERKRADKKEEGLRENVTYLRSMGMANVETEENRKRGAKNILDGEKQRVKAAKKRSSAEFRREMQENDDTSEPKETPPPLPVAQVVPLATFLASTRVTPSTKRVNKTRKKRRNAMTSKQAKAAKDKAVATAEEQWEKNFKNSIGSILDKTIGPVSTGKGCDGMIYEGKCIPRPKSTPPPPPKKTNRRKGGV